MSAPDRPGLSAECLFMRFMLAATVCGLCGMGLGIFMGLSHDHRLAPVHAHLNLLGWVTLALYGLSYRAMPEAAAQPLAVKQFWLALLGPLLMCGGIAGLLYGRDAALPAAVLGGVASIGSMLCFGIVLLRTFGATPHARAMRGLPVPGAR